MLDISGIETFYGESQILFGVTLQVKAGQVVTLLGRNGMGENDNRECHHGPERT